MQNPNNPKTKRTTKVLVAILVGLAIIIAALCATPFVLAATVREFRTINDVPAPTQTKVEVGTATVSGSGWKANMRYLASYEIQGLVVGLDDYNSDSLYDRAAPRDLSIAWGDMAAHSNLIVWLRGQREMSAEITKMSEWIIGKKYDELVTQYSNNHLIPMEDVMQRLSLFDGKPLRYVEFDEFSAALQQAMADPVLAPSMSPLIAYSAANGSEPEVINWPSTSFTIQILLRLGFHWDTSSAEYFDQMFSVLDQMNFFEP